MAEAPDPRLTPARGDVAAAFLKDQVTADRYDPGMAYQITASVLPLRRTPSEDGAQETQGLFGEVFTVYDERDGWGWGQLAADGYVGYMDMAGLAAPVVPATHRVTHARTYRFSAPDLKSAPLGLLSMNAKLAVTQADGDYLQEARGGYVWAGHTAPLDALASPKDPATVALAFLHAPYFWGGKESLGLDCSGLVQNAFERVGMAIPRDADQQEAFFADPERGAVLYRAGGPHKVWQDVALARGDLMFWPGHVGMMLDGETMIHATATHMAVALDDVRQIAGRWVAEKDLALRTIVRPQQG